MLPEGTEVMRRLACADVCPAQEQPRDADAAVSAPPAPVAASDPVLQRKIPQDNKELLRQQLLSAVSKEPSASPTSASTSNSTPKTKQTRHRQKNRWKLKFHHQALPPEYLDHYEQSLQKQKPAQEKTPKQDKTVKLEPAAFEQNFTNESLKLWAERLSGLQRERNSKTPTSPLIHSPILGSMINMSQPKLAPKPDEKRRKHQTPAIAPSKIVTYDDLPYMGEMTLNNSKPRRGRKPKKADICHLIYENYGTIVPGQPVPQPDDKLSQLSMCDSFRRRMRPEGEKSGSPQPSSPKTDLQNKIISSLLERKLTQENKKKKEASKRYRSLESEASATVTSPLQNLDEPLNLCIRDLTDLKIQIQKKFGNIYTSLPEVKTESGPNSPVDKATPNTISVIQRNTNLLSPLSTASTPDLTRFPGNVSPTLSEPIQAPQPLDLDGKLPPGYVYWPNAGLYLHPLALQTQLLYYQKLAAEGQMPQGVPENIPSTPGSTASESVSTDLSTPPAEDNKSKLVLKQLSELLEPKIIKQGKKSPDNSKLKRASPNPPPQAPVKRKRSAIFIPPMPAKTNSSTPTTEVSICKFKFTGGSKPSLQEKKMLSVDSGGNFRYYSGTGNKANRGYEYLQRDPQGETSGKQSTFTESKSPIAFTEYKGPDQGPSSSALANTLSPRGEDTKKKRKSRKSLQREKLEQTFKEKGFLIQTQQLQSAEGATYCKFRQLRKFTRYLFRSWKDYLPGNLDGERTQQEGEPLVSPETPCEEEWS